MKIRPSALLIASLVLAACPDDGPATPTSDLADAADVADVPTGDAVPDGTGDAADVPAGDTDADATVPLSGSIDPQPERLRVVTTAQFRLLDAGGLQVAGPVTWSVNGVVGGSTKTGNISEQGLYSAPEAIPDPPQVTIRGQAGAVAAEHTVTIVKVTVAVDPTEATLAPGATQTFTATVVAQPDIPELGGVLWFVDGQPGGNATSGTLEVDAADPLKATYTAPAGGTSGETHTIEARSKAFLGVKAPATVTIEP